MGVPQSLKEFCAGELLNDISLLGAMVQKMSFCNDPLCIYARISSVVQARVELLKCRVCLASPLGVLQISPHDGYTHLELYQLLVDCLYCC